MKIKFINLILAIILNCTVVNMAYCQPLNDAYYPETYSEVSASDFNCESCDAYRYVSLGVGPVIFIPNVGVGYRTRYTKFGWDTSLSFSTIGYAHQVSGHLVGHYYLNPSHKNSAYIGLGIMGSGVFTNHKGAGATISPDFVFGKELSSDGDRRHFIEMHVGIPTLLVNSKRTEPMYFPLMYIKYGISF